VSNEKKIPVKKNSKYRQKMFSTIYGSSDFCKISN